MAAPMPSGVILTFLMSRASAAKTPVQSRVARPVFMCFDTFLEHRLGLGREHLRMSLHLRN